MLDLNLSEIDGKHYSAVMLRMDPNASVLVITGVVESIANGGPVDGKAAGFLCKPCGPKQF